MHDQNPHTIQAINRRIGARVADARALRGWSVTEFAARVGLSASQLRRIEAGRVRLSVDELERLAAALQHPLTRFLDGA